MNILILVKNMEYENGGVCTQILTLSKEYKKLGHRVLMVADGNDFQNETEKIGIEFFNNIKMKKIRLNPFSFISAYISIKKIVEREKIDIVHCHTQSALPIAYLIKKRIKIPYVWTNHIDDIPQAKVLREFHKIMKFPIISVSDELKKDLMERFSINERYITVIYNGIDLEKYHPLPESEKAEKQKNMGILPNEYNICLLSRVAYNKGQDLLVRAIKKVRNRLPEIQIHLILAGSIEQPEWYEKEVFRYCNDNNLKVSYVGFKEPRDVFGVCDLFVLPSRKEGFGIVCIESLAMKCPVIRSNSPGWNVMKDYCNIININDVDGLADAIECAYKDKENLHSKTIKGYHAVINKFSSRIMAEKTLKLYQDIIQTGGKL